MDDDARKQELSYAFVHAIATLAGFNFVRPPVDDESVDAIVSARSGAGGTSRRPRLDLQLKGTSLGGNGSQRFSYPLKVKNYNDLRLTGAITPHILVVVAIPADVGEWMDERPAEMALRHCAFWVDLRGAFATGSSQTKRVWIETSQRFDVASLRAMMARIDKGTF